MRGKINSVNLLLKDIVKRYWSIPMLSWHYASPPEGNFMIDELFECDAIGLAEQIKTGIVEASDMLSASIARAERLNTSLHAIVNFNISQAKKLLEKLR